MSKIYDCLIVGGGPAGLAVATGLARLLHTAVVFDSGVYRNGAATYVHNVLGFDHQSPGEFRARARADIFNRYRTVDFQNTAVVWIRKHGASGLFEAADARGTVFLGRKVVLAVGVQDVMLGIDGYAECWSRGIFHCLFCHGYESRGISTCGVLAEGVCAGPVMALHTARMALQFAQRVTIYANGSNEVAARIKAALKPSDISIRLEPRRILQLRLEFPQSSTSRIVVTFEDRAQVTEGFLTHAPEARVNGPFVGQLGLEVNPSGEIKATPPFLETSMSGVFAAGDCATPLRAIPQAAAMGGLVATAVAHQLEAEAVGR